MPLRAVPEVPRDRPQGRAPGCISLTTHANFEGHQGTGMPEAATRPADSTALDVDARAPAWRAEAMRYGIAPASVALAFAARALLDPVMGEQSPCLFFVPAVLASAWLGGLGPGLLATALGVMLALVFVAGFPNLSVADAVAVATFAAIGASIAWCGEQLQRNRARATASAQDALAREAHLTSLLDH